MLLLIFWGRHAGWVATAVLASGDGAGVARCCGAGVAAMGAILAGNSGRVSDWVSWPTAIACVVAGA